METTEYYSEQRRRHYGEFYGLVDTADERPICLVWGNCQAEALRIVLSSAQDMPFRTVRVPPVHELERSDLGYVEAVLEQTAVLVSQPIRPGYRGLPVGTADMLERAYSPSERVIWPVVRFGGLFPFQIIVRHPSNPSAVPPGVAYHDLRTILGRWDSAVSAAAIRSAAQWSVQELAARENAHCDVSISDVLLGLGARAAHTINHPGNEVLLELGRRILVRFGASEPLAPGRDLLGMVRAPLEAAVVDALELDVDARESWTIDGADVDQASIRAVQTRWYGEHPEFAEAAVARYGELIDILGLAV